VLHAEPGGSPATQAATPMSTADINLEPESTPLTISRCLADDEELDTGGTYVYLDGVPRDASGIPLITPATVTVARGRQHNPAPFRCAGSSAGPAQPQLGMDRLGFSLPMHMIHLLHYLAALNATTWWCRNDGLAANLFESFDSPQLSDRDGFSFAPNASQSSLEQVSSTAHCLFPNSCSSAGSAKHA
jgi:hypothetical protein